MTTTAPAQDDFSGDEYNDLFAYDIGELDIEIPEAPKKTAAAPQPKKRKEDELGLDDEVLIKKKRVTVKLDEQRLMSINGLPRLRKEAPTKLKFKGKGYEYKDASRLLAFYQLWADDLFKKAKFRDTLKIIEKLGHTRTIRSAREDWIHEAQGGKRDEAEMQELHVKGKEKEKESAAGDGAEKRGEDGNDDDLYSLPTRPSAPKPATALPVPSDPNALFLGGVPLEDSDDEMDGFDDADFEALLEAERAKDKAKGSGSASASAPTSALPIVPPTVPSTVPSAPTREIDEFEDDLEAMEAMEAMGEIVGRSVSAAGKAAPVPVRDEFEDELEAMEAMGAFD
ncbi:replication fork protection component Swi3-domain-containing protein [Tricharina praecox]|uniref:replication fork protection component Swi3-domain-containing protein n=1 Tax=Tricharina praecox TaxID=43433 RepID=UPI00221F4B8E|nr:replication fork protection component Swi3-domain-containing protein [Tricharina praecox]KAI5843638.1 replication fork protection component Swi3-domain-containing protein [Tricharina praecox]